MASKKKKQKAKLTTDEAKKIRKEMKTIKKKIEPFYLKHEESLSTSTKYAWKLGDTLNQLKKLKKKLGGKWGKYRRTNFPYIDERTAQRYMRLALKIDMKEFPALSLIPITDLEDFIGFCKTAEVSIKDTLKELSSAPEFEMILTSGVLISNFKKVFKEIIKGLAKSTSGWYDDDVKISKEERQMKEKRKVQRSMQRLNKKALKKEGKINSDDLVSSTNRAAKKLVKNLDFILNKKHKIIELNDFGDLDYETIKNLFAHLKQLKTIYKNEFARDHDLPGENDV
ncbi:hypothetical protein [Desulfobacula sp.]|uniref:hypothetical protein n=1 Tax=Desulfobacula sp. TaxID=2593537 RepID=UPI00262F2000|nr:hypothetical protein [Desulfobacula sp.]